MYIVNVLNKHLSESESICHFYIFTLNAQIGPLFCLQRKYLCLMSDGIGLVLPLTWLFVDIHIELLTCLFLMSNTLHICNKSANLISLLSHKILIKLSTNRNSETKVNRY